VEASRCGDDFGTTASNVFPGNHDGIEMRSAEISDTDRYRAFVAYDPEGYYLEPDVRMSRSPRMGESDQPRFIFP